MSTKAKLCGLAFYCFMEEIAMGYLYDAIKKETNFTNTENGAVTHKTSFNKVLDMFALGGSYRNRTDDEVINLFRDAFDENPHLAIKCLFYLRDVRGGQGERRFFRVAYKWLIENYTKTARQYLPCIAYYGRWDDLIDICFNTALANDMLSIVKAQLKFDAYAPAQEVSLLAKWMPSENASSADTKAKARWFAYKFGYSPKDYRKTLSAIRKKINVLERLMSAREWDNIQFDKIPSVAGLRYSDAFRTREETKDRYIEFIKAKSTKVNAAVLNPVDIVEKVISKMYKKYLDDTFEDFANSMQKYWDNLTDYYNGRSEEAIAIVDVSGSMSGKPMAAAIGMGLYVAQKSTGRFANHFITFSEHPTLVEVKGDNIVEQVKYTMKADWGGNTNLEAALDLILNAAIHEKLPQSELPSKFYIFSDMEFDQAAFSWNRRNERQAPETLIESIDKKWRAAGYEMPKVLFWNLDARHNNIPAIGEKYTYISGFSMSQMQQIFGNKSAVELMLEVLNAERYAMLDHIEND